jgi:hypothetical protein
MQKETYRFDDVPAFMANMCERLQRLEDLIESKLLVNTPKEPPVTRQEVLRRLKTTAPTLIKWEREGKVTKLRIGRIAYYQFSECLSAMKRPNTYR